VENANAWQKREHNKKRTEKMRKKCVTLENIDIGSLCARPGKLEGVGMGVVLQMCWER